MKVSNISFSGIYDIRFPYGTSEKYIHQIYNKTQKYVDKENMDKFIFVQEKDKFDMQKTNQDLADKGVRITTTIDNPLILNQLFDTINKDLGQQYINKSKTELVLDMPA